MSEEKRYTTGEEIGNSLTHLTGACLGVWGMVILAGESVSRAGTVTGVLYAGTIILLFLASGLYHAVQKPEAKGFLRKIDHSAIYVLIAGTYTPLLMLLLSSPWNWIGLAVGWGIAFTGVGVAFVTLKNRVIGTIIYLIAGWLGVFLVRHMWVQVSHASVWYLLTGGIVYSLGTVFYIWKKPYFHTVWHLFVMGGCFFHYLAILSLVRVL